MQKTIVSAQVVNYSLMLMNGCYLALTTSIVDTSRPMKKPINLMEETGMAGYTSHTITQDCGLSMLKH